MTTTRIALWGFTLATLGMAGLAAAPAVAAPGDLDPAFGGGMRLFGAQSAGFEVARAMLVQPDGKVIVAGSDSTGDFLVRRLHADGTPDRGFSADGTAGADFDNRTDTITAIALQDDGKIVAAGKSESGSDSRSVIARFTVKGELDPNFGADAGGRVTLGPGQVQDIRSIAVLPSGGIALAGTTGGADFGVTRLGTDGSVDQVTYEPVASPEGADVLTAAARTPGGGLLVAGFLYRAAAPGHVLAGVARYSAAGKLDTAYGGDGLATVPGMAEPNTIVPTVDGGLLVAGTAPGGDTATVVARLDAQGQLDKGFGSAGLAEIGFPGPDAAAGMSVLDDGRILVAALLGTELSFGAARLQPSGELDARYGEAGIAVVPVGEKALSTAAAATTGGAFLLAGPAIFPGAVKKLAVVRLQGDPAPTDVPPTGGPGPVEDREAPALTGLAVTRKVAGSRPRIRFTVSEAARVSLTLKRRHGRATRVEFDAAAGANRLRGPRRLVRGRYRLTAVAVDAAGNAAAPVRVRFKVRAR
jgi:uncharacterized delta-60 repeat protein